MNMVESSKEDDDFPSMESVTSQFKFDTIYQPKTEKVDHGQAQQRRANRHFKKHWKNYVRTWFNHPSRKTRRRNARQKKAVKIFPRPTAGPLRPIVYGHTLKYNMKVRSGSGFTLEEIKDDDWGQIGYIWYLNGQSLVLINQVHV